MPRLHCCQCKTDVIPRLTNGAEIYPHRPDLADKPFWICKCGNYVGCHNDPGNREKPLGPIPTPELRNARNHIHRLIDPIWKTEKRMKRKQVYKTISKALGLDFHTANITSMDDARSIYRTIQSLINEGEL